MIILVLLVLLAGFASQGGRATVTYQPTSLKGDGQGCPSDEKKAQAIENFHNLIEERVETVVKLKADIENSVLRVINEPGQTRTLPVDSCQEIFENRLPIGNYWITSSNGTAQYKSTVT